MKKRAFIQGLNIVLAAALLGLAGCAATGRQEDGLNLAEAIEPSADKIGADLPAGSRVAVAA
jgi:hypothetical protein